MSNRVLNIKADDVEGARLKLFVRCGEVHFNNEINLFCFLYDFVNLQSVNLEGQPGMLVHSALSWVRRPILIIWVFAKTMAM
jgi:hypothetical protein